MSINLALILTLLTVAAAVIVMLDKLVWKTADQDNRIAGNKVQAVLVEYARSFLPVLFFVLVIRSFVFEPFRIPSGSMKPTLLVGDFIFVKKYSYGLRLPVTETKILETGTPQRGDVAVFRLPKDPSINYIKRVIGIPGDEIRFHGQQLTINGITMEIEASGERHDGFPVYREQLDGREHDILLYNPGSAGKGSGVYVVPDGKYFMMGDNRDDSRDSRFIGEIDEKYLVGEAVRVWMHFVPWNAPDWGRIGMKIE